MVYGRDSTYIFTRAPVQIGIGYCHLHGCSYHFYGRGPVLRHQESERERTGYDKYRIQEDLRQGEEILLSLHGDGIDLIACTVLPFPVFSMIWAGYCVFCEFVSVREKSWQKAEIRKQEKTVSILLENKEDLARAFAEIMKEQGKEEKK